MFQVRRRVRVTREGWYYLLVLAFILLGIVLRQVNLLVVLAGLMIGLFVFHSRLTAQMLRMIDVRRRLPDWICAGDPLLVEMTVANRRRRIAGWAMTMQDTIALEGATRKDGKTKVELIAARIEPGGETRVAYRFQAQRRGRYRFGPVRVATRFPFGLVNGAITLARHDTLLVCPRLGRLSRAWAAVVEGAKSGQARAQHRKGLVDGEFYGLRDWRPGDSPRWIHWRTSAKLDKLSVRQFEQQRNRDVALLLDLWRPEKPSDLDLYHIELAVSFAATAVADICRRGGSRLLFAHAGATESRQAAPASMIFMQDILRDLALVEAGTSQAIGAMLKEILEAGRAGERVVVISTRRNQLETIARGESAAAIKGQNHPPKNGGAGNGPAAQIAAAWSRVAWIDVRSAEARRLFRLVPGGDAAPATERTANEQEFAERGPPRLTEVEHVD